MRQARLRKRLRRVLTKGGVRSNRRRDFHHKTARALVDAYDALALEDLRVANMTASASGTIEAPGRTVAQKAGLNRAILDAGWGQFTAILTAKAESWTASHPREPRLPRSTATPAGPDAPGPGRTRWSAPSAAR